MEANEHSITKSFYKADVRKLARLERSPRRSKQDGGMDARSADKGMLQEEGTSISTPTETSTSARSSDRSRRWKSPMRSRTTCRRSR